MILLDYIEGETVRDAIVRAFGWSKSHVTRLMKAGAVKKL